MKLAHARCGTWGNCSEHRPAGHSSSRFSGVLHVFLRSRLPVQNLSDLHGIGKEAGTKRIMSRRVADGMAGDMASRISTRAQPSISR